MSRMRTSSSNEQVVQIFEEIPEDNGVDTDTESEEGDEVFGPVRNVSEELERQYDLEQSAQFRTHEDNMENLENSLEKKSKFSRKKEANNDELDRRWKKKDHPTEIADYLLPEGPAPHIFEECTKATDYFLAFVNGAIENIIFQSNLYATQKDKTLRLDKNEFLAFIGINFLMGYHRLPSWRDYWASSEDLGVNIVSQTMSRNRFDTILSNLHVNDNSKLQASNKDRLYKLRPMIDSLNENFYSFYHGTRQLSVDESMIAFKGRNSMKQYNPMKPVKRGYKLWCLADNHGYIKKFSVYQGKDEQLEDKYNNFGLGERVVLSMTEKEWGKDKIIFFDNYFTSVRLLEKLKCENTYACGTIRANRIGNPKNMKEDKKMKRGDIDYRVSVGGISFFKWYDNKAVLLASNYHGNETATVPRRDRKGIQHHVICPLAIKDYNAYMGGVDHADQLRAYYGLGRRSKKWWHRIFWGVLEIAFVNSFIVYTLMNEKRPLLEYRRMVATGLMTMKDVPADRKSLKRKSTEEVSTSCKKRRGAGKTESVSKDVRLGNLGIHWPKFTERRGRCEMCSLNGIQSKPFSICTRCSVYLCCNDKKNCFQKYHGINA